MSFLESNIIFEESDHTMITIAGEPGMGKTTLGAMCESPLFIRSESGTRGLSKKIPRLPVVKTSKELFAQLSYILKEEHLYKTLVFDTISTLDLLFVREIVASDPNATTINDAKGGWGAGFNAVADMHQRVHRAASMIMEQKGMNILFLAHTDIKTINPPDREPYMKYVLRMMDKSADTYINLVDAVGFIRQEVFYKKAKGAKVGKVTSNEKRVIIFGSDPALVSKNRFGITRPVTFNLDQNPLTGIIPGFDISNSNARTPEAMPEPEEDEEYENAAENNATKEENVFADDIDNGISIEKEVIEVISDPITNEDVTKSKAAPKNTNDAPNNPETGEISENESTVAKNLYTKICSPDFKEEDIKATLKEVEDKVHTKSRKNVLDAAILVREVAFMGNSTEAVADAYSKLELIKKARLDTKYLEDLLKAKEAELEATGVA